MKLNDILCTFFYFCVLLLVAMHLTLPILDWGITKPDVYMDSTSNIYDVVNINGSADPASFASGALFLFKNGWFKGNDIWYINLWPPGFMVLEFFILKIFGEFSPIVGILQVLSAFCMSVSFNLLRKISAQYLKETLALAIPLIPLISVQFRYSMLAPQYIVYGEPFAISFFLTGTFLLLRSVDNPKQRIISIFSGLYFALSAYFRPQFEFFVMIATALFISTIIWLVCKTLYLKLHTKKLNLSLNDKKIHLIIAILISITAFHALTFPYRIYNYYRNHTFMWVLSTDLTLTANFTPFVSMSPHIMEFLGESGANVACQTDSIKCIKIYNRIKEGKISNPQLRLALLKAFISHPITWITLKLHYLPKYWHSNYQKQQKPNTTPSSLAKVNINIFNYIFIICLIYSLLWLGFTTKSSINTTLFWQSSTIILSYIIIFTIGHYESRYFYFFKFYFFIIMLICASQVKNKVSKTIKANCSDSFDAQSANS